MPRPRPLIAAAILALDSGSPPCSVAHAASDQLRIAAQPGLFPSFRTGVTDYATRCDGKPLRLSIDAPGGDTVVVDGGRARSGSFKATVPLDVNEATSVNLHAHGHGSRYHVRCLPRRFPRWRVPLTRPTHAPWFMIAPGRAPTPRYTI